MNSQKIRDSFIFYRSFYQSAKKLPKEDKAELFDAICSYALDGEEVDLSVVPEAIFTVIKPNLDANRRKWENGCKEKKKTSKTEADEEQEISKDEANDKQTISKSQGNVDVNVDVNANEECKSKSESKRFSPPTFQQVSDYCQERKNSVSPNKFIDHYQSNGWKVGKNSMKDWKAAVRKWEGNSLGSEQKPITPSNPLIEKLNSIAGKNLFSKTEISYDQVLLRCHDVVLSKEAKQLPVETKEKIKEEILKSFPDKTLTVTY